MTCEIRVDLIEEIDFLKNIDYTTGDGVIGYSIVHFCAFQSGAQIDASKQLKKETLRPPNTIRIGVLLS